MSTTIIQVNNKSQFSFLISYLQKLKLAPASLVLDDRYVEYPCIIKVGSVSWLTYNNTTDEVDYNLPDRASEALFKITSACNVGNLIDAVKVDDIIVADNGGLMFLQVKQTYIETDDSILTKIISHKSHFFVMSLTKDKWRFATKKELETLNL